ncbi:DUF4870 domain-containing protein [Flavobacterium sp. N1994]|uniref:DUF4870 domain-containing protein n=1 Tax=Flavobacterium sp. N1994 TaxID=2986827 RepID=UPI0022223777|nr:DUF4870 domain-containing protein [Flavobacterium sp. N1994]
MTTTNDKSIATVTHLSCLTQYFIPFGNYIFPIIIWSSKKDDSEFIDYNGKQVLNFQLSIFLYTIILCLIAIPILVINVFKNIDFHTIIHHDEFVINNLSFHNFTGVSIIGIVAALLVCFLKVAEFCLIINAAVKTSNGEYYKYPLSIPFFK